MRKISTLHVFEFARMQADVVANLTLGGATAVAVDWPAGARIARFCAFTTAGLMLPIVVNLSSTQAALTGSSAFSSGSSQSSNLNVAALGEFLTQVPGPSTGFSVIAPVAGQVNVECWQP